MKRIILVVLILLLSACNSVDRYNFSGNTDNWSVEYTVDVNGLSEQDALGALKYVGEEPAPDLISFIIDMKPGTVAGNDMPLREGIVQVKGSSCSGCAIVQDNQEIEVTINWAENEETFIIKQ